MTDVEILLEGKEVEKITFVEGETDNPRIPHRVEYEGKDITRYLTSYEAYDNLDIGEPVIELFFNIPREKFIEIISEGDGE